MSMEDGTKVGSGKTEDEAVPIIPAQRKSISYDYTPRDPLTPELVGVGKKKVSWQERMKAAKEKVKNKYNSTNQGSLDVNKLVSTESKVPFATDSLGTTDVVSHTYDSDNSTPPHEIASGSDHKISHGSHVQTNSAEMMMSDSDSDDSDAPITGPTRSRSIVHHWTSPPQMTSTALPFASNASLMPDAILEAATTAAAVISNTKDPPKQRPSLVSQLFKGLDPVEEIEGPSYAITTVHAPTSLT